MKRGFYFRLAFTGIRKNRRLYLPYLLTCIGMVAMYYIISALAYSTSMQDMMGATSMGATLSFGKLVIALFSLIFLFYTNSFLTRRRKKEFGLYNVLGMSKGHLARILVSESGIVILVSLTLGLLSGVVLSKLAELILLRLLREEINYAVLFSSRAVLEAAVIYTGIFLLLLAYNVMQVGIYNPLALMKSEAVGEKDPKANWVMTVLGIGLLAGAYYLAVSVKDPIEALTMFFVAVLMVIVATYLLLISGSVTLCRFLQKRKNYYYKPNHFVSVSSMAYRMKRSGASLASICILSTMVLVTLSSTGCMYFGMEDMLAYRYPHSVSFDLMTHDMDTWTAIPDDFGTTLQEAMAAQGYETQSNLSCHSVGIPCYRTGTTFYGDAEVNLESSIYYLVLVPQEDYNRMMGTSVSLAPGQALAYAPRGSYEESTLELADTCTFQIAGYLDTFPENSDTLSDVVYSIYLVIPDAVSTVEHIQDTYVLKENHRLVLDWFFEFDVTEEDQCIAAGQVCEDAIWDLAAEKEMDLWISIENRDANRADFLSLYGGLFFLGVLLSIVFLFAAVLMIYYKQISEGYEDQARFGIMQKVGMTRREIRQSVNSQILLVFFLPLLLAGVHLAFAFPMIHKVLILMNMTNTPLLIASAAVCYLAFTAFYTAVYKLTSNAYYSIVANA